MTQPLPCMEITIINYEELGTVEISDDQLLIANRPVMNYTFTKNYYFMMGIIVIIP